ncbi:phosphotransferase [Gorillibacterium massiliense]|uniref:phosphotransferase n=1 Tax=Gorillibacterium massiliense TaxID=1280390 RepID=UPI0004B92427|nr:phosphotransferase [Gorillibacterium massiliense]
MNVLAICQQILTNYPIEAWTLEEKDAGFNNTTRFIHTAGQTYVLRVYENHRDENKLRFEHYILDGLSQADLSFSVPRAVRTLNGETFTVTADGKLAALFVYIPGERPSRCNPVTSDR